MLNGIPRGIRLYFKTKYFKGLLNKGLKIGKNTHIMDGVFLDPSHCYLISIGDNCTLAPNVRLIAHDASLKKTLGVTRVGLIKIEDNCFIGDSSIVLPGITIGLNSVVGAGSVVTKSFTPNVVVAGNPAKVIMSFEEFKEKQLQKLNESRPFLEASYDENHISIKAKREMILYLERNSRGYLKD